MTAKYQSRVMRWMYACFGEKITDDKVERNHRFLEESLELVQALGYSKDQALQMVEYVYSRPAGNPHQEIGGTLVCLAALAHANGLDMEVAGEDELIRCFDKTEIIRNKHANKPSEIRG
jgi:hypothetical protein